MALWMEPVTDLKSQHIQGSPNADMLSRESGCLISRKSCNPSELTLTRTSSLLQVPQVSVLSDEFSRPAVIGHVGICNTPSDSPAEIREILLSVLTTADGLSITEKEAQFILTEPQDSDMENWENSTDDELNEGFDSDDDCGENVNISQPKDIEKSITNLHADAINCNYIDSQFKDHSPWPGNLNGSPALCSLNRLSKSRLTFRKKGAIHANDVLPSVCSTQQIRSSSRDPEEHAFSSLPSTPEKHFKERSSPIASAFHRLLPTGFSTAFNYSRSPERKPNVVKDGDNLRCRTQSASSSHYENVDIAASTESLVLTESTSQEVLRVKTDLLRENAHFIVADMIISAMENLKCNIRSQQAEQCKEEYGDGRLLFSLQPGAECDSCSVVKQHSDSSASLDSGYESCPALLCNVCQTSDETDFNRHCENECDEEIEIIEKGKLQLDTATPEDPPKLIPRSCSDSDRCSPEVLAQQLYKSFRKQWLPAEAESHFSSAPYINKQEFTPSDDMLEIKLKSRMRGTSSWAPPRFIIIFNIHPTQKRDAVIAAQNFLCAGCGTQVEPKYIKKLRYCEYLGKYFCDCCHSNEESCIPGRMLMKWDFSKFPVCNFSKDLLEGIWQNPLFNVSCINKEMYTKVRDMDKFREVREQIFLVKRLLKACRFAESILQDFEQVPTHLTEELHLFSLDDLVKVKRGILPPIFKNLLKSATAHVESCELCQANGFICEFCRAEDVLFPFQMAKCLRCKVCKACFHKGCFKSEECPRCARIDARKQQLGSFSPVIE